MKRFTKMLALGMTLAMVFGMSVSAAPSPEVYVPGNVEAVENVKGFYKGLTTKEDYENAEAAANSDATKAQLAEKMPGWEIDWVVDIWDLIVNPEEVEGDLVSVKVKLPALPDRDNYTYAILHWPTHDWSKIEGYPEVVTLTLTDWENNYWDFKVKTGSPVAFVRLRKTADVNSNSNSSGSGETTPAYTAPTAPVGGVVSPKTGEAIPVATVMTLVCLAGVAVCAKKVRSNS